MDSCNLHLSLQGGESSTSQSGFIVNGVVWIFKHLNLPTEGYNLAFWVRKTAHFTEYFILGLLGVKASYENAWKWFVWLLLCIPLLDESIQFFTPGRVMSGMDMGIDASGYLLATYLLYLLTKRTL